jgi:hypothetical protein
MDIVDGVDIVDRMERIWPANGPREGSAPPELRGLSRRSLADANPFVSIRGWILLSGSFCRRLISRPGS